MVPVSIAAVLVLGIGVSLRMQLEQPGVETSVPAPAAVPETPAVAPPAPSVPSTSERARDSAATVAAPETKPVPQKKVDAFKVQERREDARAQSNLRAGAVSAPPPPQATTSVVTEPPPAAAPSADASAPAPAAAAAPAAPAARLAPQPMQQSVPLRAKREAESDSAGARDLRKSLATPEIDPARELERIAQLRAEGRHAEADRALEEFRRQRPDYRIPDGVWERVKPR